MTSWWRVAPIAVVALGVLGGCAGATDKAPEVASLSSSAQPSAAANASDRDKFDAYAKCMREHGVDVEVKPVQGGDGGLLIDGAGSMDAEATRACTPLLPNGGAAPKLDAAGLDARRAQAKCLREHGLEVPDPTAEKPELTWTGGDSETVKKAMDACLGGGGQTVSGSASVEGSLPEGSSGGSGSSSGGVVVGG
ncbi:MAG TPA: hypothetical protein VM677_20905 [Actinokineospora sp.]|jgi:hypothetical protein|nr:hypothetical protein [Actinokineospora sp.]